MGPPYDCRMLDWDDDLKLAGTELYMDGRRPRPLSFVSHAHSDHLAAHAHAICTPATAALSRHREEMNRVTELDCAAAPFDAGQARLTLLPAGHVLGSAMLHATRDDGRSLLYTGDFRLRPSLTASAAEPRRADVLVMESTYGLPSFRFPPREAVAAELVERVEAAFRAGRQPIVMGYSLGKAQEIVRILTAAGHRVTCHGAVYHLNAIYERQGVPLGAYRRYDYEDFHGPAAIDLRERGVLVAPPRVARTAFVTRFDNPFRVTMTGWALMKNAIYRYGVDAALPLSDHADFDELLELIDQVKPSKIYTHHGYREFAETLRGRGLDATCAKKDAQLTLFGD
jgi:Cft2 family RNA processing exonuclease